MRPARPLEGRTAVVTGAARGLGRALSEALCQAGARVVLIDVRSDAVEQASHELNERGFETSHCAVDVGDADQVERCLEHARERFGALDILINNAGVDYTLPLAELEIAQWDHVMSTNLRGPFLFCKRALTHMKAVGGGHIINIASTAAKRAWPNASAYHASKWALLGFSHALHAELRPLGIKVTAVIAGGMRTPFLLERFPDLDPKVLQAPEAVAAAVVNVLTLPPESVVAEISVLPMGETSWP
ncbi:MAG: SDR family oxidoreductase [Methyloversatilis sp.]|nr:SDR family oxidoreductase [Methyloversatilis sp.]